MWFHCPMFSLQCLQENLVQMLVGNRRREKAQQLSLDAFLPAPELGECGHGQYSSDPCEVGSAV